LGAHRQTLAACTLRQLQTLCGPLTSLEEALPKPSRGPGSRERRFSLWTVFWTFLWQVLHGGSSCREATARVRSLLRRGRGLRAEMSEDTSAYCAARLRLPLAGLQALGDRLASALHAGTPEVELCQGRRCYVLDATTCTLPDTPAHQARYPQPSRQTPGCGFPVMRVLALFDLSSGAWQHLNCGSLQESEAALWRPLREWLPRGSILVHDRGQSSYAQVCDVMARGCDLVMRRHASRHSDFRTGRRLGGGDHLVIWKRPKLRPRGLPVEEYAALPGTVTVREIRWLVAGANGTRVQELILITTLTDALAWPAAAVAALYLRRWEIELRFDDVKTTLGMDMLRGRSPAIAEREVAMHRIAYNCIRLLMQRAAAGAGAGGPGVHRLSFKGTLDRLHQYGPRLLETASRAEHRRVLTALLEAIARDEVPKRPGRHEPRQRKRRPKAYPLLTCPRHAVPMPEPRRKKTAQSR
jgi:hypothetical protein